MSHSQNEKLSSVHSQLNEYVEVSDQSSYKPAPLNESIIFSSLFAMMCLLFTHWIIPKLRKLEKIDNSTLNSIGAGLALGYVFLHALPDIVEAIPHLKLYTSAHFLKDQNHLLFVVFLCVLSGFLFMYALEKIAHDYTKKGQEASFIVYASHIWIISYLTFSVAMTMPFMASTNKIALALFTIVMSFHFILEDHVLMHHFPSRFNKNGRKLIMMGALLGLGFGLFAYHYHMYVSLCFMNAFLLGALILATTKTEFSLFEGSSHFPTFIISVIIKAVIIFVMILLKTIE